MGNFELTYGYVVKTFIRRPWLNGQRSRDQTKGRSRSTRPAALPTQKFRNDCSIDRRCIAAGLAHQKGVAGRYFSLAFSTRMSFDLAFCLMISAPLALLQTSRTPPPGSDSMADMVTFAFAQRSSAWRSLIASCIARLMSRACLQRLCERNPPRDMLESFAPDLPCRSKPRPRSGNGCERCQAYFPPLPLGTQRRVRCKTLM